MKSPTCKTGFDKIDRNKNRKRYFGIVKFVDQEIEILPKIMIQGEQVP